MQEHHVSFPELMLIAATRGMLGFGAGMLLAEHVGRDRRKVVGSVLLGIGALSTIPLAIRFLRRPAHEHLPVTDRS
jgi:hypothetical protein